MAHSLDPHLLDLLVCPLTKEPLRYDGENERLISERANLAYPVRDGIPILLIDEAEPWSSEPEIPLAVRADPAKSEGDDER